ncbi:MAG: transposase [Gemmatimonadales bacterium]
MTFTTWARAPWLGRLSVEGFAPAPAGATVMAVWSELPKWFPRIELSEVAVLPDHVHGLVELREHHDDSASLGDVVRVWKAVAAHRIHPQLPEFKWTDGYWDRIVRTESEFETVRAYVSENVARHLLKLKVPP